MKKPIKKKTTKPKIKSVKKKEFFEAQIDKKILNFHSLNDLKLYCKSSNILPESVIVYVTKNKNKSLVPIDNYAFSNKYFDVTKSKDESGFYFIWEWDKQNPFSQKRIVEPIKTDGIFEKPEPIKAWPADVVVDVIPKKTRLQKFLDFFKNLFNTKKN